MSKENSRMRKEENPNSIDTADIKDDYRANKLPGVDIPEEAKKEMEKTKAHLEKFKDSALKKYPFILSIGIIPPQAAEKFEEEESTMTEEEKKEKPMHVSIIIPEDNFKDLQKIKAELVKEVKEIKPKVWLHIDTPVDVWNFCLDSKFELMEAVSMSFPLYDKGFLGALRVANIHKSLVIRKFEKYVSSYVMWGSLVRGTSKKDSDVDVAVIIDDTDVKRMPRLELKEKLRGIISNYIFEAENLAGVKNKLNCQVYLMTDFWESVKDAHPVIFTLLRDGIPIYDKGTFLPWKLLLKMGKIKPSPEAIDMFMSMGDKLETDVKRRILDLVVIDIYWGVLTPSQALLMLNGSAPPTPKEVQEGVFRKVFVEQEKMLEKKYADILEKIVTIYKDYEHGKVKEMKGEEVDKLLVEAVSFLKRLKELRTQIEKKSQEKTIYQLYEDIMNLLKGIINVNEKTAVSGFEKEFVKKGRLPSSYLHILKDLIKAKEQFKKGKLAKHEVEDARKNASLLINALIEYAQRCEIASSNRGKMQIKYKGRTAELILTSSACFLVEEKGIFKIHGKLEKSSQEELEKAFQNQKENKLISFTPNIFELLKKELGDFEVVI
jgi:predicted nucleotidyltransferase/uncharacterized protein (UPF0332 family)